MADPAGRRWLRELLANCHVWQTSFATNALRMAAAEGERSVGIFVLAEMEQANFDMFLQMLKEKASERPRKPDSDAGTESDPYTESDTDA